MVNETNRNEFKRICELQQSPNVDIEFQDLSYTIKDGNEKRILKSVSGKFNSGQLTGILGVSGSGKTTLLNVLSGCITHGVSGSILVNGMARDMQTFKKVSAYIFQEDLLQSYLTAEELMLMATRLKLSDHISFQQKNAIVLEVLNLLGLGNCLKTLTNYLSGGERKRLSIALEMVNNPPVIFLDEPTNGLDTVAINQCIEILKLLTEQGRTVICTIHQPTDSTFQNFDQVYFLHDGMCIYNGSTSSIVPFMSSVGYECPITYSPSDYLIETVHLEREAFPLLTSKIQNGKLNKNDSPSFLSRGLSTISVQLENEETTKFDFDYPTRFWTQFFTIFSRMMLQIKRNKFQIYLRVILHVTGALLIGFTFFQMGNDAKAAIPNVKLNLVIMLFFAFSYLIPTALLFPLEVQLLKREYINRWYDLKPYFLALNLKTLPILIPLGILTVSIVYLLTDQPLELQRFIKFTTIILLNGLASEGLGLLIGSVLNAEKSAVVASALLTSWLLFSFYGMGYKGKRSLPMEILIYSSYLRISSIAQLLSLLDDNRAPFKCNDEDLCYYKYPRNILKDVSISGGTYNLHLIGLIFFVIFFRLAAYVLLRLRFTCVAFHEILNNVSKIVNLRRSERPTSI